MTIYSQLLEREDEQNPIKVGIIGAGQMGYGMISQIAHIPGMIVVGISDINLENAEKARASFNEASEEKVDIEISEDFEDIIYSKKTRNNSRCYRDTRSGCANRISNIIS